MGTGAGQVYNGEQHATIEIKSGMEASDHESSTPGHAYSRRAHGDAQHRSRRASRTAYEGRQGRRHPLRCPGPGSFALSALAPGPRPCDVLVCKLQMRVAEVLVLVGPS